MRGLTLKQAVNWNTIIDEKDKLVWDQIKTQIWYPEEVAVSNDRDDWRDLTPAQRELTMRVFTGLTLLDTIQGSVGVPGLIADSVTPHEEAVLSNFVFFEHIHAQSYSYIFQTLASTPEIDEAFYWSEQQENLQFKARRIQEVYATGTPLQKKAASVLLESFLFYSGFFWPLYLLGNGKMTDTGDVIKLIIRDEAIHGHYIGYKFGRQLNELPQDEADELRDFTYDLMDELFKNELEYTKELYTEHGLVEDVKGFLHYNANRALMNMGLDPVYPNKPYNSHVRNGLSLQGISNDFFSGKGKDYQKKSFGELTEEQWGRPVAS